MTKVEEYTDTLVKLVREKWGYCAYCENHGWFIWMGAWFCTCCNHRKLE